MAYDYQPLINLGIEYDDAVQLRRISMTLQRWFELECGDSNNYASWSITRGEQFGPKFLHNDNGKPYIERHIHTENRARYEPIADRENGAKRRLARIMAKYPALWAYVQTDPRGASLYIGKKDDTAPRGTDRPLDLEGNYTRGIAVYK